MKRLKRPPLSEDVVQLRARVKHWRKTRRRRSPMPEALWEDAASLARVHGVYPICRELRLNYENLKKRAAQAPRSILDGSSRAGGFVELQATQILGASAAAQTVLELSDGAGMRLMLRLAPGDAMDVPCLIGAFRRERP